MDVWALVPLNLCKHASMGKWCVLLIVLHNRQRYISFQHSLKSTPSCLISVLRVWDVILFEGNRVMLFRTALALMDLYGTC